MSIQQFGRILEEEPALEKEPQTFGRVIGEEPKKLTVSQKAARRTPAGRGGRAAARGGLKALGSVLDLFKVSVDPEKYPEEKFSFKEAVDVLLPQHPEAGFAEKTIERGSEILPYLLGGEAALIPKLGRAGLAALLGQTTEELGGGELAQTGAEVLGLGLPGLRKKIVPKKAQEKSVEMLRRRGLTEKEIAPLIPSERKSALVGKLGARGFRTQKAAKRTREALGDLYSQISAEGEKLPILSSNRASLLESQLRDKLEKLPSSLRRPVEQDLTDLFKKPVKADELINFWQDINSHIDWRKMGHGKKRLNSLKETLFEGIKDISPDLAQDFETTNALYGKFNTLYKNLKPRDLDRLIALGETGAVIGGLLKFGPKGAIGALIPEVGRRVASEMLINPRLQNLTKQMVKATQANKIVIAKKISEQIEKELKEKDIDL